MKKGGKEQFCKDLEKLFQRAFEEGNLAVALKVKELLARIYGFYMAEKGAVRSDVPQVPEMSQWSDEQLETFIQKLEASERGAERESVY